MGKEDVRILILQVVILMDNDFTFEYVWIVDVERIVGH